MIYHLEEVRDKIKHHQNRKLVNKWDKHGDYRKWDIEIIINALKKEIDELLEALKILGPDDIIVEIVDVRNCTEFLFDYLSRDGGK